MAMRGIGKKRANQTARARRRPGRPGGAGHTEAVREALLRAARELFAQRDFRAVSVRGIAARAKVNPALVHYHFGDKRGLYRAMLQQTLGPVLQRAQAFSESGSEPDLRELVGNIMRVLAQEPWVPRLIVREVLAEEGAFRDIFAREFAAKGGGRLPAILARERERGVVRQDLDLTLTALSIMSMTLFPFVAQPVVEQVFGLRIDDAFARRLAEHTVRLLFEGAGPRPRGGKRK
ncbi:TetR family transcriptional regulator [Sulfurifustis variabilis]|uniref:TetR family transcriptional regulator n=1 Tax=Sulfurifustis variabilis TaxID=1675686 RepID=A0A1B4VA14_9GAMM|nr:CerR family C-terminal domain-containing protein [Sulfurifustis variabilis]BAU48344.1 TetR family transcriptional regulator [Sulfurifustis variabilis]